MMPPSTQHSSIVPGACSSPATVAGTLKMPLPIATPTLTAMVCSRPPEVGMRSPHWPATVESRRDELDPVMHREGRPVAQMQETADVGRGDELRRIGLERGDLGTQEPRCQLRLQQRVGAGGAAAAAAIGNGAERETSLAEQGLDHA